MLTTTHYCPLCKPDDERILWQDAHLRVIRVDDEDYPGYLRVIWTHHVGEMSDLSPRERQHMMEMVMASEEALRECIRPDKINLASFGNMVPHLHWHVIARFRSDRHFPQPVWGTPQRESRLPPGARQSDEALADALLKAAGRIAGR
ncbi:MAG: HIT family protein [Rhodocyclaceae bacterium]|nr:HIT family protein [Rhodocyclaceae bacterium]